MFYLVATPIGNLKDITLRALEVLRRAEVIVAEDTRRTRRLLIAHDLSRGEISAPRSGNVKRLVSFHDHSSPARLGEIVSLLKEGKEVALVCDAGTPLLSDPGFPIVREAIRAGVRVEGIPGPSALTAALMVSGLPTERFTFLGFLPAKQGARKRALEGVCTLQHSLVFFESPHRIEKVLADMLEILGDREAALCRELTKKFEEILRGNLSWLVEALKRKGVRGEMVLVVAGEGRKNVFK